LQKIYKKVLPFMSCQQIPRLVLASAVRSQHAMGAKRVKFSEQEYFSYEGLTYHDHVSSTILCTHIFDIPDFSKYQLE
jgi:hypothetical protein